MYERTQKKFLGKVSPGSARRTWTWDPKMKEQHEPDQESENKSKQLVIRAILWHVHRNLSGFNTGQNILLPQTPALAIPVAGEVICQIKGLTCFANLM